MADTLSERNAKTKVQIAEVERMGEKIILPEKMDYDGAILQLQRMKAYEEQTITVQQSFDAFPWDGAHALTLALKEKFGWYSMEATPGFFGDEPPQMIAVEVEADKTVQIPWGMFSIPVIKRGEGAFYTGSTTKNGRLVFQLSGSIR